MKKITLLVLLIFLTACGSFASISPATAVYVVSPPPLNLRFAVNSQLDSVFFDAAVLFSETAAKLSGDQIVIDVYSTSDSSKDFDDRKAAFTFLDSTNDAEFNEYFPLFSTPFRFDSYKDFTISSNADTVLDILTQHSKREHNMAVLGSFYAGSRHLLSTFPLSGEELVRYIADQPEKAITVGKNSPAEDCFIDLGALVVVEENPEERRQMLFDGRTQVAEYEMQELLELEFTGAKLYLNLTYHTLNPKWLVADNDVYTNLSQEHILAVKEALAAMSFYIDDYYITQQNKAVQQMVEGYTVINLDFLELSAKINSNNLKKNPPTVNQRYLLEKIASFS